jgi:hypothetical protein
MESPSPLNPLLILGIIWLAALGLLIWLLRRATHLRSFISKRSNVLTPLFSKLKLGSNDQTHTRKWLRPLIEIAIIVVWALWVGRAYLDPDPNQRPNGNELGMVMQPHFPWTQLSTCGECALWNGWINGGAPTAADIYGAATHPLVIAAVSLFGLVNGAKILIVISFSMAGLAQWWLAKALHLSWAPRLWSAALAIVSGGLAGRLQQGLVIFVFSVASTSLLLAPTIQLIEKGQRRTAIVLGVLLGLALLSGQGYMQVAIVFGLAPALVAFIRSDQSSQRVAWKEFALAGLIAILIAAILWIPMLHFWPNFGKRADLNLNRFQPIESIPLNMIVADRDFYTESTFGRSGISALSVNYIGLIPVLLAVASIFLVPRQRRRQLLFFGLAIGLVFVLSSGLPILLLLRTFKISLTGIRFPSYIASLAVPLVLALAAWSVDLLLKKDWTIQRLRLRRKPLPLKPIGLLALIVLPATLLSVYDFSQVWLISVSPNAQPEMIDAARTDTAEWIRPPQDNADWLIAAANANLKMIVDFLPWAWKNHALPHAAFEISPINFLSPAGTLLRQSADFVVFRHPDVEYAYIQIDNQTVPCQSVARGGNIDVECQSDQAGQLIVEENRWDGWFVTRDGVSTDLGTSQWLSTLAPAGTHHYEFRYRPWDMPLGLLVSLSGLGLATWLWIRTSGKRLNIRKTPRVEINEQ